MEAGQQVEWEARPDSLPAEAPEACPAPGGKDSAQCLLVPLEEHKD